MKYLTALYREAMTPAVLAWDPSSNNRAMLAGQSSLVMNAISITRSAENDRLPIASKIAIARPPRGPAGRVGLPHATSVYVIWKFAGRRGREGVPRRPRGPVARGVPGQQFLQLPAFPDRVKDLGALLAKDAKATPPDKYAVLADALEWMTNLGAPGYANAALDDAYGTWVLNTMFARAATGADSPEAAVKQADQKLRQMWQKWQARGLPDGLPVPPSGALGTLGCSPPPRDQPTRKSSLRAPVPSPATSPATNARASAAASVPAGSSPSISPRRSRA